MHAWPVYFRDALVPHERVLRFHVHHSFGAVRHLKGQGVY